jgi:orotate phosphoribosyltransferase-like protein
MILATSGHSSRKLAIVSTTSGCSSRKKRKGDDLLMFGIPSGGVIVADIVAEKLNADYFDIVIPRKLRAPDNKENVIGAMSQDGAIVYLDDSSEKVSAASTRKRGEEAFTKKGHFQSKPNFFLRMFPQSDNNNDRWKKGKEK